MNKTNMQFKANVALLICNVSEIDKQNQIIEILEKYEKLIPDGKFKDCFQKIFRKRKDFYDKAQSLIDDIFDRTLTACELQQVRKMMEEINAVVNQQVKNWWDQLWEWFDNATK